MGSGCLKGATSLRNSSVTMSEAVKSSLMKTCDGARFWCSDCITLQVDGRIIVALSSGYLLLPEVNMNVYNELLNYVQTSRYMGQPGTFNKLEAVSSFSGPL